MLVVLSNLKRKAYLDQTISNIKNSTNLKGILVIDNDQLVNFSGWKSYLAPKPKNAYKTDNRWATWSAFELAVEANEDLIFLEDDVVGCINAINYTEQLIVPDDCALVQLYVPWGSGMPYGIWRYPAKQFAFCQALKIPVRTLKVLIDYKEKINMPNVGGSDNCMAKILGDLKLLVGVHYPNLFQHIGDESTISPISVIRISPSYDETFDALSLLKWWPNHYI